ncbi:MAG: histidine kinase dimerization/phosphoacceptor domain -containing protein [Gracilimonas sp.]
MAKRSLSDEQRLDTLYSYDILDSEEDREFDNLAKLAAQICEVPLAKINFLDDKRQWSKANYGNDIKEMPLETSFCSYTIVEDDYLMVEDASKDDRFNNFEFVVEDPKLRFYAGVNIKGGEQNIGTICVLGREPKSLSDSQLSALKTLANEVEARLELRKNNKELATITTFLETSVDLMLIIDPETLVIERINKEGTFIFGNKTTEEYLKPLSELFPQWDYIEELRNWDQNEREDTFATESVIRRNDELIHLKLNAVKKYGKWLITGNNITQRKTAEEDLIKEKRFSDIIIDSLPIDFYMFDEEQNLIRWNKNVILSTGYSNKEVQHLKPNDFFKDKDEERIQDYIRNTMNGEEGYIEADLEKKDGTSELFLFNATAFEINDAKYLIGTGQSICRQKENQEKLENILEEKDILLTEVHHRVKNNLAVISGFLQMEEFIQKHEQTKSVLMSNHMRVKSMALIHEDLYKVESFSGIKFDGYLNKLLDVIKEKMCPKNKQIELVLSVDSIEININQAIPLALIINELVSNAYKYAFEGRNEGTITVDLNKEGEEIHLRIKDDGIGLPEKFVLEESPTLGATLVMSYSEQIDSDINIKSENGTEYQLTFKNKKSQKGSSSRTFI